MLRLLFVAGTLLRPVGAADVAVMRVNGLPIATHELALRSDAAGAASRLAAQWRKAEPAVTVLLTRTGDGFVVGRQRGPLHQAVLIRPAPGRAKASTAVVSVMDLRDRARVAPLPPFAPPRQMRVLQVIESLQPGALATQLVAIDTRGLSDAALDLERRLMQAGWRIQRSPRVASPGRAAGVGLSALRGSSWMSVVLRAEPAGTSIVAVVAPAAGASR